ncbi:MAG: hypothetical protein DYG94_09085 [Leptolyngbya sp. PLA3]|nr:MAG: hypothetical protein EDM82_02710 [Cyanobacteria bacterium CYA]MCE7968885.1 hypothetical protein [Leptolyngbya sp. PL-A3]
MMARMLIPPAVAFILVGPALAADPRAFEVSVTLSIEHPDHPISRQARFTLRLSDDRFRLELGQVVVVGDRTGEQASLLSWHQHDPTSVFIDRDGHLPALVRRDLPPIWCGLLADWLAQTELAYPLAARDWASLPHREEAGGAVILESPGLRYERRSGGDGSGLLSESVLIERLSGDERLDLTYTPVDPGDAADWSIDPASRRTVSSIAALRPQPARFAPGDTVSLRLFRPDDQSWAPASVFEQEPSSFQRRHASALVLAMIVLSPRSADLDAIIDPADSVALLSELRTRVASLSAQRGRPRPIYFARPVALFDVPGFNRDRLEAILAAAADLPTDPLLPDIEAAAPRVLWAQPPEETIDLFCPGARFALIILDPQRRLLAAIRVDAQRKAAVESAARVLLGDPLDPKAPGPGSD